MTLPSSIEPPDRMTLECALWFLREGNLDSELAVRVMELASWRPWFSRLSWGPAAWGRCLWRCLWIEEENPGHEPVILIQFTFFPKQVRLHTPGQSLIATEAMDERIEALLAQVPA